MDYLPQKVNLEYEPFFKPILPPKLEVSSGLRTYPVTLFFDDIDGIDVIILEALKEGETKPTKIPITDLSTGSYSIQLDKTTTFTAIAYNKNGMSKGNPLTVPVSFVNNSISAIPRGNCIEIKSEVDTPYEYHFLISSLEASNIGFSQTGKCTDNIDISNLPVGHYVLKVMDHEGSVLETIKFLKD